MFRVLMKESKLQENQAIHRQKSQYVETRAGMADRISLMLRKLYTLGFQLIFRECYREIDENTHSRIARTRSAVFYSVSFEKPSEIHPRLRDRVEVFVKYLNAKLDTVSMQATKGIGHLPFRDSQRGSIDLYLPLDRPAKTGHFRPGQKKIHTLVDDGWRRKEGRGELATEDLLARFDNFAKPILDISASL